MNQTKDLPLSLKSDTFSSLSSDFDSMLRQLLQGMVETGEQSGTINIKVKVSLTEDSAPDFEVQGHTREITKPKFEHEVSAVIQRKDKRTGSLSGDYELVRDGDGYFMRHINDGQYTLFDDGQGDEIVDADAPGEPAALPAAPSDGKGDDTPFGWLKQFVGMTLRVTEAMGNFTVRSDDNKVILSSAASPDAAFYCPAEKLEPHVGHKVVCVGYGEDELVTIAIECEDCGNELIYDIDCPDDDPVEVVGGDGEGEDVPAEESDGDREDKGGYGYEAPSGDGEGEEEE